MLLVHGIWNSPLWLWPLERRLRTHGFEVLRFGYRSVSGGPDWALPRLAEAIRAFDADGVVGHSLGGLMTLETLRRWPDLPVRRVVCLGSPLAGSAVAQALVRRRAGFLLGRSGGLLCAGVGGYEGQVEVGQIAGGIARGVGRWLAAVDAESDGTVGLHETRIPGLCDHCVAPASHSGLVLSAAVARQAAAFLGSGRFAAAGGAAAIR